MRARARARGTVPEVRPLVRHRCRELGVPYTETGLLDSYAQALRHMREVGASLRA